MTVVLQKMENRYTLQNLYANTSNISKCCLTSSLMLFNPGKLLITIYCLNSLVA